MYQTCQYLSGIFSDCKNPICDIIRAAAAAAAAACLNQLIYICFRSFVILICDDCMQLKHVVNK
jgi:hypothetical protein